MYLLEHMIVLHKECVLTAILEIYYTYYIQKMHSIFSSGLDLLQAFLQWYPKFDLEIGLISPTLFLFRHFSGVIISTLGISTWRAVQTTL